MNYRMLSKYRTELMGVAMLWVMFFHASDLDMGHWLLEWIRAAGFGGVDIFILLSAMGLVLSVEKRGGLLRLHGPTGGAHPPCLLHCGHSLHRIPYYI